MKKIFLLLSVIFAGPAFSQPGKDGAYSVTTANQVLNKYCPVAANINAGASTVTLSTGPGFSLCPGDLIMIYQAQGATYDASNSSSYGNILNYNSAGLYEFKYVQSVNGNVVTVQTTFTNSYQIAGRVQAVKVPQYTTLTINAGAGITCKPWLDTTILAVPYRFGGLVVIHASSIVNNGNISASGFGFRGGALDDNNYGWGVTAYVSGTTTDGGEKGEGICGYQTDYDANGGRFCMGAPGNGGGGGNTHNSAAGGGGNGNNGNVYTGMGVMIVDPNNPLSAWALDPAYIANGMALTNSSGGGRGGYSYGGGNQDATITGPGNAAWGGDLRREVGGRGGRPLTNINAETRIYFGGGGGAGDANNNCTPPGANGAGIVYLIATTGITGTGTVVANGNNGGNSMLGNNDAASGAGAGGSIVIKTPAIVATQAVIANGGLGGNQLYIVSESEGSGGGGGGGFVAISGGPVVPSVNGGLNGNSQSTSVTEMISNGGTKGALGQIGNVSSTFIPFTAIPSPVVAAPTVTQTSCTSTLNAFNLNLVFNPANPSYTINWSPLPNGVVNNTQTAASGGISPGVYNATVLLGGACSSVVTSFTINPPPSPVSFTVMPSYTLTCTQQTVFASLPPGNTYTWSGPGPPLSGNTVSFTPSSVGNWTVYGTNPSGCTSTQTFAVIQNTFTPTNSVNPVTQAITCASNAAVTFSGTVTNLTVNLQHNWYGPLTPPPVGPPIATSGNTLSILSGNIPPGTYTLITTNLVNGCTAQKTVNVTSLSSFPTFNIGSTTNFSVGCSPLNQTTLSIINPVSTQTPPATCSYTFLAPSFTGVVTPSVVLGGNTSTVTQTPGTWTVIVQDNSNFCRTQIFVPIIQNTVAPNVGATIEQLTQTLTCYNPTLLATGTSTTPNTVITWNIPQNPPLLSTATVNIGPASGPNTSTTSLTYANYTVISTNTVNACVTTSVVQISQNFKPPISSPTISIATPTAIYCTVANGPVVLTTGGSTTTSGGGPLAFAVPYMWQGPSPQLSLTGVSSYTAYVPGIYSLTIRDNYNGCFSTNTVQVLDKTQPPIVTNALATSTLDCGTTQAGLLIAITGATNGLMYWITKYPVGAAFNPTNAITPNINPFLSGTSASLIKVSAGGTYEYIVSNTITGCQATGTFQVYNGAVNALFDADAPGGFSPLNVNFTNRSQSSTGSTSITSVWSFGNGTVKTTTSNITTSALYESPGTYTVTLFAQEGLCTDTAYKVIVVDLPSKLTVPNIFTPNGDGANDLFILNTAAITEVQATLFDRWGNKVYEVNSSTGNISWDGTSLSGKECAAGVYFYIIKGKGKDEKEYSFKGNVTLLR